LFLNDKNVQRYIAFGGIKRGKIRSALVEAHVRYHFFGTMLAIAVLFLTTSDYQHHADTLLDAVKPHTEFFEPMRDSVVRSEVHKVTAYSLSLFAGILFLEKMYLVFGNKPAAAAKKGASSGKKNN
jgi:hypothetical protein